MTERPAPKSSPIARLSPTSLNRILACPMSQAFRQQGRRGPAASSPAARLGRAAHGALEIVVGDRSLFRDEWRDSIESVWANQVAQQAEEVRAVGDEDRWGDVERWPGYFQLEARLRTTAQRLRTLFPTVADKSEFLVEVRLSSEDPPLEGTPDLVVRTTERTTIVDYKTGIGLDPETGELRAEYERQLQIYAYLEHGASGVWPSSAWLVPFKGRPIELLVDERSATAAANEARAVLNSYNALAPASQPGRAAATACRYCPFVAECPSFWASVSEVASAGFVALRGSVREAHASRSAGVTLVVEPHEGPADLPDSVVLQRLDPVQFPEVSALHEGDEITVTGLYRREADGGAADSATYRLAKSGRLSLHPPRKH